jgi:antirestriction protein ArdC
MANMLDVGGYRDLAAALLMEVSMESCRSSSSEYIHPQWTTYKQALPQTATVQGYKGVQVTVTVVSIASLRECTHTCAH